MVGRLVNKPCHRCILQILQSVAKVDRLLYYRVVYLNGLSVFYLVFQVVSESSRGRAFEIGSHAIIAVLRMLGTSSRALRSLASLVLNRMRNFGVIFKRSKRGSPVIFIHKHLN